jgi:hypothetical protein
MRRLALCFAIGWALVAPLAHAQDAQNWTAPSGRFGLAFEGLGWRQVETPANDPEAVLGLEHNGASGSEPTNVCFISERRETFEDQALLAQSNLNAVTTEAGVSLVAETAGVQPTHSDVVTVDGVAVVEATFGGSSRVDVRVFYIGDGGDLVQVMIYCGAKPGSAPAVQADVGALMQTLRIHPE